MDLSESWCRMETAKGRTWISFRGRRGNWKSSIIVVGNEIDETGLIVKCINALTYDSWYKRF